MTILYFAGYYLIVPVLLTALAASGFQRITYEADPEYLFSPINGHSKLERQALEKHFPMNYSEFDAGQKHRILIVQHFIIKQCQSLTYQAF